MSLGCYSPPLARLLVAMPEQQLTIVPSDEDVAEVAAWEPLTDAQLNDLAGLLRPLARAVQSRAPRRRVAATPVEV